MGVVGPAGFGKTTLVRAVLRGREHVEGPCLSSVRWKPYAPLSIALREELAGPPEAVASDVRRLLGDRVLFVDDLHWSDDATLNTLAMLAGHVPLVVTTRPDPVDLDWVERGVTVELHPLPPSVSRSLAAEWHPELSPGEVDRLVAVSGGNPLLLQHLAHEGRTTPTLRAAAAARLADLPPAAAAAVRELALLGRPVDPGVLSVSVDELPVDLVEVAHGRVALRHPLLADAAIETLDAEAIAATHRRVADRLPAAEAATHHLLAGDRQCAQASAMAALEVATGLAQRAHLLGVIARASGEDRWKVEAAAALVAIGDWTGAEAIAADVSTDDPEMAARAAYQISRSRWFAGDAAGAREALTRGLELVAGSGRPVEVRLLVEKAAQRVRVEEATNATTPIAEAAMVGALATGVDVPRARLVLATAQAHDGRADWEPSFRRAMEEAARAGDAETECAAAYYLASHLGFAGRAREAIAVLEEGIVRAAAVGLGTWRTHMEAAILTDLFIVGTPASELIERAREFVDRHPLFRNRAQIDLVLALSLGDVGRHDEARAFVDTSLAERQGPDDRSILLTVASELAWLRADLHGAVDVAAQALALGPGWFGITAGAACAAALARFELDERDVPPPPPIPKTPFFALHGRLAGALHRWSEGDDRAALDALDALVPAWAASGSARYELATRWAAAVLAIRLGDPSARRRLTAILDEAERRGLRSITWRASVALSLGDTARLLTAREAAVLALIADGCGSRDAAERLGIARATVESHVQSAMRKLGATTRAQAVSALRQLAGP